jgi:circadian clock protein KaiB
MIARTRRRAPRRRPLKPPDARCVLRLFIAGATARSHQAVLRVRNWCAARPAGSCALTVVDIYQLPELARIHQIVATPTLVRESPPPVRRFIGNLSDLTDLFGDVE